MKIYSFGDSHADYSFRNVINDENQRVALGPVTMHRVRRDKLDFLDSYKTHRDVDFDKDSFVVFCFGEIDIRCHIKKQIEIQGKKENEVINNLISEYVNYISRQKKIFKKIGILSITPPASVVWASQNNDYPFMGTDYDRARYTIKANGILKKMCAENDISFIDVHRKYSDEKGMLIRELSDGGVHIGNTVYVENEIKKIYNGINIISSI